MKRRYRDIICIIVNAAAILANLAAEITEETALFAGIATIVLSIIPLYVTFRFSLFNKKLDKEERIADFVIIVVGSCFAVLAALLFEWHFMQH